MSHLQFDSPAQMREHLRRSLAQNLHPLQANLKPGDCWVRFDDIAERRVIFGQVLQRMEIEAVLIEQGAVMALAQSVAEAALDASQYGVLYSLQNDHLHAEPHIVVTYASKVWPIEYRLYAEAQRVDWQIDQMEAWGKLLLNVAFRSQRAHARRGR